MDGIDLCHSFVDCADFGVKLLWLVFVVTKVWCALPEAAHMVGGKGCA